MAATLKTDGSGHLYAEVENIRITYVPASDRKPEADWAGSDVLRIQAYRGSHSKSLFMGAELPVQSPEVMVDMVAALCAVYNDGRRAATPSRASEGAS